MRELKHIQIEKFIDVLRKHGPMTTFQMQKVMNLSKSSVDTRVLAARRADLIHISGYSQAESNRAYSKRIWAIGPGEDLKSDARTYREKLAERKRREELLDRVAREIRPFRDPLTTAFYGAAHAAR